jgi:hypothetical protein
MKKDNTLPIDSLANVQTLGKNSVIESKIPWLLSATSARS